MYNSKNTGTHCKKKKKNPKREPGNSQNIFLKTVLGKKEMRKKRDILYKKI